MSKTATKKKTVKPAKKFSRMTKAEKRVAIAKDVLEGLRLKKLVATNGTYFGFRDNDERADWWSALGWNPRELWRVPVDIDLDAKPAEPIKAPKQCSVCAIGSVFVSAVDRFDELTIGEASRAFSGGNREAMTNYLGRWFPAKQLALMETVFEGSDISKSLSVKDLAAAVREHGRLAPLGAERTMEAIMRNIIRNGGALKLRPGTAKYRAEAAERIEDAAW